MNNIFRTPLLLILGLLFLAGSAQAQGELDDLSDTHRAMAEEMGEVAAEWWNPRLNTYKRMIDRVLSDEDREKLDQMRVRFAILVEGAGAKLTGDLDDETNDELDLKDENGESAFEVMEIWMQTVEIAMRYEGQLTDLQPKVFGDIISFSDELVSVVDSWAEENRTELATTEEGASFLENRTEVTATLRGVSEMKDDFSSVYGFIVEPLIMLFNGGDLRDMFPGVSGGNATAGTEGFVDLLAASSVMMQNYPNPADQRTTVPVNLKDEAAASMRIYNDQGSLVKTLDLGTLSAGEGSVEIETGDLESGTYLYQLVLQGSDGEELHSKVMQVVR